MEKSAIAQAKKNIVSPEKIAPAMNPPTSNPQFLTIEEKRAWLAKIFRDTSGEYTAADKLKALQEDTNLALIQQNHQIKTP